MNAATRAIDAAIARSAQRLYDQSTADQLAAIDAHEREIDDLRLLGRYASDEAAAQLQIRRRTQALEPALRLRMTRGMAVPPARPDLGTVLGVYGTNVFKGDAA